jgi:hypothetical protein
MIFALKQLLRLSIEGYLNYSMSRGRKFDFNLEQIFRTHTSLNQRLTIRMKLLIRRFTFLLL